MANTNELLDKVIIFFACLGIYLIQPMLDMDIAPIIIAVILSSLFSYVEKSWLRIIIALTYVGLCILMPSLTVFIPLFCYDLFRQKYQRLIIIVLLPCFINADSLASNFLTMVLIVLALSLSLKSRTYAMIKLKISNYHLADDARELSVQMKNQNRELEEKRDSDVHLATLKERNRIAREIHDHVGHQLSSAILQIGALLAVNKDQNLKEPLAMVSNTLSQGMNSIRESIHDLHDQSVDLHMQVEALLEGFTFCEVSFENQLTTEPEKMLKLTFIAIIKEALSNIIKHSNATMTYILLREHPAFYQLIIKDNGSAKAIEQGRGIGLVNMTDRVQAFHGNIHMKNENGFEIFISVPKEGVR